MKIKDYEYYFFCWLMERLEEWFVDKRKRRLAREWWHRWYAWRPVRIAEAKHDAIVVPAHYVWLDYVDTQRAGWNWYRYRPNTLDGKTYSRVERKIVKGAWADQLVFKTIKEMEINYGYSGYDR